jgi:hypothetical protein
MEATGQPEQSPPAIAAIAGSPTELLIALASETWKTPLVRDPSRLTPPLTTFSYVWHHRLKASRQPPDVARLPAVPALCQRHTRL